LLNPGARITLCGMISQYGNTDGRDAGQVWRDIGLPYFDRQKVIVHPLHVRNYVDSHQAEFLEQMGQWLTRGEVRYREDVWTGLESAPRAFRAMLEGGNFGKTLVQVSKE
jgi:NADPH-dependent curcumin reductase CurA